MREFLKLMTPQDAWKKFSAALEIHPDWEEIATQDAIDRVVAFPVNAPHPLPSFSRSAMDGYAVRAKDTHGATETLPASFAVVGEILMGMEAGLRLEKGQAALIHTGGMLPEGADAVVMLEYTQPLQEYEIGVERPVAEGENVIYAGEEVQEGAVAADSGLLLRPVDVGALLALGIVRVRVKKKIRVGILSTGDEVLPPDRPLKPGKVRDVNTYTISGLVARSGGIPVPYGIVPDSLDLLFETARRAHEECDLVVICAGSSASHRDITADVINRLGKPGVLVHGISTRPGKPTILSLCDAKPVFGLPGNPVSAYVVASHFLRPTIQTMLGCRLAPQASVAATLTLNVPSQSGREDWIPVILTHQTDGYHAEPLFIKSNFIFSLSRADGLIRIPADENGLSAGTAVEVNLFE